MFSSDGAVGGMTNDEVPNIEFRHCPTRPMKTLLKTLLWMIVLVAAGAYIGKGYVLRAWNGREAYAKQFILNELKNMLPDVEVELDEIRYDFGHEIMLTGFSLTPPRGDVPIVKLPETLIHINRDALIERQQLEVLKVVVKAPRLEVVREADAGVRDRRRHGGRAG
jgi:hypothetical protein